MKNYMEILADKHPGTQANCTGDTSDYNNIIWIDTAIPQATLDADYLDVLKGHRYDEIDYKTGGLIYAGFAFDSQTFSLSASAQVNWNTLKNSELDFIWPVDISTIDNNSYSLAQTDLDAFWTAARDAVKTHLDSGRALKKSVYDAATEAAVNAVVDNR